MSTRSQALLAVAFAVAIAGAVIAVVAAGDDGPSERALSTTTQSVAAAVENETSTSVAPAATGSSSTTTSAAPATSTTSIPATTTVVPTNPAPPSGSSVTAPATTVVPTTAPPNVPPPSTVAPPATGRAVGFGRAATGGTEPCIVTSLGDQGPGTLRDCAGAGNRLVTFAVSGRIEVPDGQIDIASHTTVDGAGQAVTVAGMLDVKEVENVIVRNLTITGADPDAIRVLRSHTAWFDHLDLSSSADGLIDITDGSTDVTISWSHFHDHDKMVLVNPNSDTGVRARVTLHHNWFENGGRRYPSSEVSDIHGFNNYMDGWSNYAVLATEGSRYRSEHNVFRSSGDDNALLTTFGDEAPGEAVSIDDRFIGEVDVQVRGEAFAPNYPYQLDPTDNVVSLVTSRTGPNR